MKTILIPLLFVLPMSVVACPDVPDTSARMADLVAAARAAETEMAGREIGSEMWEIWGQAPDEQAQAVLDQGRAKISSYDLLGAITDFETLIAYCPRYAEGYNQRAFAYYLGGKYEQAIVDLDQALLLRPDHVAARAGLALSYMQLGRLEQARDALKAALDLNPWLSERSLMAPGGPLEPKGEDI
jgi:tetratricopeptide (TPR) repeat protein